ncbi:MAG: hypothetical protein JWR44_243 [Hymenobacter sp.]|nr:hypothetical protein [Hymenobacter sp.]
MEKWYRPPGVRPREAKGVAFFLARDFLRSTGTMLVYLTACVSLLATSPEHGFPLGYCIGAVAMALAGRVLAHFPRSRQALPALQVALGTLAMSLLLVFGPTLAVAVALMVAYRMLYLLPNPEAAGQPAAFISVRPNHRQARLFIAADLAGKAMGALLSLAVPASRNQYSLLVVAVGLYAIALVVHRVARQAATTANQALAPRLAQPEAGGQLTLSHGGRALMRSLGFGLTAVVAVAIGLEYFVFINVHNDLQEATGTLRFVSGVLVFTYLVAMVLAFVALPHRLPRINLRILLAALPLTAFVALLIYSVGPGIASGKSDQLISAGGLLLTLELLRRMVLEPVFQLLMQALPLPERAAGYGQLRSLYEPLGMGATGVLLLVLAEAPAHEWLAYAWMGIGLVAAALPLQQAYYHYLEALKRALGLCLAEEEHSASKSNVTQPAERHQPSVRTTEVIRVIEQLHRANPAMLAAHAGQLLTHPDSQIRSRMLTLTGPGAPPELLLRMALTDREFGLREKAGRLAGHYQEADKLLLHSDAAVRQGAIRGRLQAFPDDALAQAALTATMASAETCYRLAGLALISFLPPEQQLAQVMTALGSPEPALVRAATRAASQVQHPALGQQLIAVLRRKAVRKPATASLMRLGPVAMPLLKEALLQETDGRAAQHLAQPCALLGTAEARQLLVEVAQSANLHSRAASLRALGGFASVAGDAPLFHRLVEEELQLAQQLLHGMVGSSAELRAAVHYELQHCLQRLLNLLLQLYDRPPVLKALRNLARTCGHRPISALKPLEVLVSRPLYRGLQALLEGGHLRAKLRTFDELLGPTITPEDVHTAIVRQGATAFSPWTIGVALREWHPQPDTVAFLYPHLLATNPLIQESAQEVLRWLPLQRPAAYDALLAQYPTVATLLMSNQPATSAISAHERVLLLKSTALFAETPENVLAAISPIMKEVSFQPEQEIFGKGSLGASLFIICEGEVSIVDDGQQLATFHQGDFFGELALLDTEPRSAAAIASTLVVAYRLDQEDFYEVMEERQEVLRGILRVLCLRLRRQNKKVLPVH